MMPGDVLFVGLKAPELMVQFRAQFISSLGAN